MKKSHFFLMSLLFLLTVYVSQADAVPDITGNYSGTCTTVVSICYDSENDGTYDCTLSISISTQSGNTFSGIVTTNYYGIGTESIQLTGTITDSGQISGSSTHTFSGGGGGEGIFTGQLYGNTLSIENTGHDTYDGTCSYVRTMVAVREGDIPSASFSASPTGGSVPLNVNFSDESTGNITSWSWNFGDGSASTVQNPSHTYSTPGSYTVSLKVTGPNGSNTKTLTNLITVNPKPLITSPVIALLLLSNSKKDQDKDGYTVAQGDCNDSDVTIYPGANEICGDGIDQDCSGSDLECDGTLSVKSAGQVWMDRNLGASRAATSYNDTEAYGDLYQWGRGTDGHEKRGSSILSTLSTTDSPGHSSFITPPNDSTNWVDWRMTQNDNLWQGVSGTNNPCPTGFRLPTLTELDTERASWSNNNSAEAFASPLKLVVAGNRALNDGTLYNTGSGGRYWSSTVSGRYASFLYFDSNYGFLTSLGRALGFSVRCLKD